MMPITSPTVQRSLQHACATRIDAYAREDSLWNLDAPITDHKTRGFQRASGVRPVGEAIHVLHFNASGVAKFYPRWANSVSTSFVTGRLAVDCAVVRFGEGDNVMDDVEME